MDIDIEAKAVELAQKYISEPDFEMQFGISDIALELKDICGDMDLDYTIIAWEALDYVIEAKGLAEEFESVFTRCARRFILEHYDAAALSEAEELLKSYDDKVDAFDPLMEKLRAVVSDAASSEELDSSFKDMLLEAVKQADFGGITDSYLERALAERISLS